VKSGSGENIKIKRGNMNLNHNKRDEYETAGKIARLSIDLLAADHKKLKTVASLMGMTMKDLVVISVGDFMQHRLNQVARQSAKSKKAKRSRRK
jgi:hypothetical protein